MYGRPIDKDAVVRYLLARAKEHFQSMSQDRASWLSTATVLFFIWSFLSLCVRVWVKLGRKHKWGVDDSAISAALVCLFRPGHENGF